jgi:hypothetical protein
MHIKSTLCKLLQIQLQFLIIIRKRLRSGSTMKIQIQKLNLTLRQGILNSWLKWCNFIFCSKQPWPTKLDFYIISSFLSNCTKHSYLHQSYKHIWKLIANIREEKNRDIVFREIINTLEIKPISLSGVFCLGVYYTRDNTYKDYYIRQGRSQ